MLLFLGAGASTPFGIPTMSGFLNLFNEKIGDNFLYSQIKQVFGEGCDLEVTMTITEDLSKNKDELFRTISPQTAFFLLNLWEKAKLFYEKQEEAGQLLDEMKDIIRNKCEEAVADDKKILDVYDTFFKTIEIYHNRFKGGVQSWVGQQITKDFVIPSDLNIFTTNYDTCVEVYFNRRQIEFSSGIRRRFGENIFDVDSYSSNTNSNVFVKIFKLHGSIDLFNCKGRIRQMSTLGANKTFFGDECGDYLIRWPIEFGGYRHVVESPYLEMFRLLRESARDKWWFLIGFSFRDRTICSILNNVLEMRPKKERPYAFLLDVAPQPILERLSEWGFQDLKETLIPLEAEFGKTNLTTNLNKIAMEKELINK